MAELGHYSWDFDRPPAGWMQTYTTFSVGIFQWLPKAGGKGIKKSKAIARVLGFTEEPERVYAEANRICGRLNRERARAMSPPIWLRKQYSVPRPAGMVKERISADFTAAQVRSMRLRVMKDHLLPADFVVGQNASYMRRHGEQIHLINFQGSKYGHEFTVNLGFHYSFVPPLLHQRPLPLGHFDLLDCIVHERIGCFLPEKRDTWFAYGQDRDVLLSALVLCATTCLTVFDRCAKRWLDPSIFLRDFSGVERANWSCVVGVDKLAVAFVELRLGQLGEVKARLDQWAEGGSLERPALHAWLSGKLKGLQGSGAKSADPASPSDWVTG